MLRRAGVGEVARGVGREGAFLPIQEAAARIEAGNRVAGAVIDGDGDVLRFVHRETAGVVEELAPFLRNRGGENAEKFVGRRTCDSRAGEQREEEEAG